MAKASKSVPAKGEGKIDHYPGRVRKVNEFFMDASQTLELAQRLIPWLSRFTMIMSAVAIAAMVVSLGSLWVRPDPLVLLSFPDGTTHCTPPSLNPVTGAVQKRKAAQLATCAELDASNMGVKNP